MDSGSCRDSTIPRWIVAAISAVLIIFFLIVLHTYHAKAEVFCGKSGPGVTRDGECIVKSKDEFNGCKQSRVTEYIDCRYIYNHCFNDDFKGWATPWTMIECKIK